MQEVMTKLRGKFAKTRYLYRNGGAGGLLFCLLYGLVNRATRLLILRVVKVDFDEVKISHLNQLEGYRYGFFKAEQMRPWAEDPDTDLSHEFLDYARAKGDECFAIFDGDLLANYCWCSEDPTLIEEDLHMEFHPGYYYRYKEFTRVSHRGRRLSSYNSAESLRLLRHCGKQGFAGYVEADNIISYRSVQRKNHTFVGTVVVLGRGPQPWIWHSPGARQWGFRVARLSQPLAQGRSGQA